MSRESYRVVQWATGVVGQTALRQFIENPVFELVGVLVTNPEKVGKDAGTLVGLPATTGVLATDRVEDIFALKPDCVHFAPLLPDLDMVCRLLAAGINVVCPIGPWYPVARYQDQTDRIAAACREGGASFHGSGVHPGFSGDLLPLTMARLNGRIDRIQVFEIVDKLRNPMVYIEQMGFGRDPDDLLANPSRSAEAPYIFTQSMELVLASLGKELERVTTNLEVATANADIPYARGVIRQGTVAGQHFEWTGWVEGKPFFVYHFYWTMGPDITPDWAMGDSRYRLLIDGDYPMEVDVKAQPAEDGRTPFLGLEWTALMGVNVVPQVCDAAPGMVTHLDLGLVGPRGQVR